MFHSALQTAVNGLRISAILFVLALLPLLAHAQSPAIVFERTKLMIATQADAGKDAPATATYDVELRPEDSLRLEYIHTLNTLTSTTGVLIGFEAPAITPLPPMKVYVPVDVLFIAEDGTVMQIAPNVVLGELAQTIQAKNPIKGLLFLKAGEAASHGFAPHHSLASAKIFLSPPVVQE